MDMIFVISGIIFVLVCLVLFRWIISKKQVRDKTQKKLLTISYQINRRLGYLIKSKIDGNIFESKTITCSDKKDSNTNITKHNHNKKHRYGNQHGSKIHNNQGLFNRLEQTRLNTPRMGLNTCRPKLPNEKEFLAIPAQKIFEDKKFIYCLDMSSVSGQANFKNLKNVTFNKKCQKCNRRLVSDKRFFAKKCVKCMHSSEIFGCFQAIIKNNQSKICNCIACIRGDFLGCYRKSCPRCIAI